MSESRSRKTAQFIAVKIDVVASRRARDRSALQAGLFKSADRSNHNYKKSIASQFVVTHGDEVQGMLHTYGYVDLLPCLEAWNDSLRPYQLRFGVGIGSLSTEPQPRAIGMDGECWHLAKEAVDTAHKERRPFQILGFAPHQNQILSAFANLLFTLRSDWTEKQAQAVALVQRCETQVEAAQKMGVAAATFSAHLSAAHWHEYREGRDAFEQMLQEKLV